METNSFLKGSCRNCHGHIEFPQDGLGQSIPCPHCGSDTLLSQTESDIASPKKRNILVLVLVLVGLALMGATLAGIFAARARNDPDSVEKAAPSQPASNSPEKPRRTKRTGVTTKWDGFTSGEVTLGDSGGRLIYATGSIRNTTDRQRFGVRVELGLFDAREVKIGTASDYTQVLEPQKEWSFKALVTNPKAEHAEIVAITEN